MFTLREYRYVYRQIKIDKLRSLAQEHFNFIYANKWKIGIRFTLVTGLWALVRSNLIPQNAELIF